MDGLALHGDELLKRLVAVAIKVAGARTVDAVLSTAGEGVKAIGLKMIVAEILSPTRVRVRYTNFSALAELGSDLDLPFGPLIPGMDAALAGGLPVFVADLKAWVATHPTDPFVLPMIDLAVEAGLSSFVVTPLMVNGQRWGGLALAGHGVVEGDVAALSLFGEQVHSALEGADTIEGLERRNRELEQVHAIATAAAPDFSSQRLLETIARATHADAASLHRFEPETDQFSLVGEPYGLSEQLFLGWRRFTRVGADLPKVSASRPTTELEDVAKLGYRHLATVLLSVDEHLTGLLTVARKEDRPFSGSELRTSEILGVQVSALLDRARLNAESARHLRQLKLMYEMTSAGAAVGQAEPLISRLLNQMLDAFPVDAAAIHFVERTQLHLAGWTMRKDSLVGPPTQEYLPIDETTTVGQACVTRAQVVCSMESFPSETMQNAARLGGLHHLLASPLRVGERLVGTLSLARKADPPFSPADLKLAESCAVHIAVILEHLRLFDDLKKSYDELAQTQAALVKHERLAALGELAAVMAHEVRNPLGVIFNSLTSLKRLADANPDAELLLQIISEEADRLNRIVGDLLDFARPYEALTKPIALEPIIAGAVDAAVAAMPGSSSRVVIQFPAELPQFQLDAHLVRQVFINLVVNALQAMPTQAGTVTVRALPEEREGQLWARVEVRDEGVGIAAETAERIFEPFFTTKATGTGLGLAVVKRIVDAHHGEVTVQSRPTGGTTFTVRLPGGSPPRALVRSDDDADTQPPLSLVPNR